MLAWLVLREYDDGIDGQVAPLEDRREVAEEAAREGYRGGVLMFDADQEIGAGSLQPHLGHEIGFVLLALEKIGEVFLIEELDGIGVDGCGQLRRWDVLSEQY